MASRDFLTLKDLDPDVFRILTLGDGTCVVTLKQLLDFTPFLNCNDFSECSINDFGDVITDGANAGQALTYDESLSAWVPKSLVGPTALVTVDPDQLSNNVNIVLGYQEGAMCLSGGQTAGDWRLYNNNSLVASGIDLFGTINLDFTPFINGGDIFNASYPNDFTFDISYEVADDCGTSIASSTFIVNPAFKEVFTFTGTDQNSTAPAWATGATVKAWGAGGGGRFDVPIFGGTGAYNEDTFTAQNFTVVVGEGGYYLAGGQTTPDTYGFGGGINTAGVLHQDRSSGGGLSGVFTGAVSQANALLIAGGGGGVSDGIVSPYQDEMYGSPGGSPGSGGEIGMQGASDASPLINGGSGGGGGGYQGGSIVPGRVSLNYRNNVYSIAEGGSSFGGSPQASGDASTDPPNTFDPDYDGVAGKSKLAAVAFPFPPTKGGGDGLVVITWTL